MRIHMLIICALLLCAGRAGAHGMRTAYLEVNEERPGRAVATFRMTMADPLAGPVFPAGCEAGEAGADTGHGGQAAGEGGAALPPPGGAPGSRSLLVVCDGPLAGRALGVRGLGPVLTEAVVRVRLHDGAHTSAVLVPAAPSLRLPGAAGATVAGNPEGGRAQVLAAYVGLGVRHILSGGDHLLFLLGLLLLQRRPRALLLTETAFTLSHSLTFSAVALGLLRVSSAAAEACIALSLLLLALDVTPRPGARGGPLGGGGAPSPGTRHAAALAFCFGLVHGLGFAGGLGEIGLPPHAVGLALCGFAVGVELGQVAFLIAAWLLGAGLLRLRPSLERPLVLGGGSLLGVSGSFWLWQRLAALF